MTTCHGEERARETHSAVVSGGERHRVWHTDTLGRDTGGWQGINKGQRSETREEGHERDTHRSVQGDQTNFNLKRAVSSERGLRDTDRMYLLYTPVLGVQLAISTGGESMAFQVPTYGQRRS